MELAAKDQEDGETLCTPDVDAPPPPPEKPSARERCWTFYSSNSFVLNVIVVICVARAPWIGAEHLAPQITASQISVSVIFFFTGLGLKTRELIKALANYRFNAFVQLFNLGVLPVGIWCVSSLLRSMNALSRGLANGIVVCASLPMTVNMVIVLTKSAGGDEAAAVFNSACGNLLGVFVTPGWVVALLGKSSSVDFVAVLLKLSRRVLGPLFVGQLAQYHLPKVAAWAKKHKPRLKKLQEGLLTFIVYCAFCNQFKNGESARASDVLVMVVVQCALLGVCMGLAWFALGVAGFPPALRVMGLFGCTHKTVAMGVPLIGAIWRRLEQGALPRAAAGLAPDAAHRRLLPREPAVKWIAKHRASAEVVAGEAPDDAIEAPPPDSPLVSRKAAS
ncbi:symporter [Aureococcus anophagefferens]|nr:symporter [Aureococcus anophagefferens]